MWTHKAGGLHVTANNKFYNLFCDHWGCCCKLWVAVASNNIQSFVQAGPPLAKLGAQAEFYSTANYLPYFANDRGHVIILVPCEAASLWFSFFFFFFLRCFVFSTPIFCLFPSQELWRLHLGANSGGSSSYTAWRPIRRKNKFKSVRRAKSWKMIRWLCTIWLNDFW